MGLIGEAKPAGGVAPTLTLDGSATAIMSGNNSGTITLSTNLSNDIIVLAVISENNGGAGKHVTGVSDGSGLTWASRASIDAAETGLSLDTWWAYAPSALSSDVITYTLSGSIDDAALVAFGVNGASNTTAPWDTNVSLPASASTSVPSTPASVSGVSTSAATTMLIGVAGDGTSMGSHSYSPDTGFSNIDGIYNGGGSRAAAIGSQYKVVSSAQSGITLNSGISASPRWVIIADAIR